MGRTLTVADLMDTIRRRGEWRSPWCTDAELTDYINDSLAALQDLITVMDPLNTYLMKWGEILIVSGTAKYALPSDLYNLYGISIWDGTKADGYVEIERMAWGERYADGYQNQGSKAETRWQRLGDYITLQPTPNWNGRLRLEYARALPTVSATTDSFDLENSWHEWTVLDVCVKLCAKEESDPSVYLAQKDQCEKRMAAAGAAEEHMSIQPRSVSSSATLAGLRHSIRSRGKWDDVRIVTQNMLTDWINGSIDALEDFVLGVNPVHSAMLRWSDITVVSGTGLYSLPSECHTLYGVSVKDGTVPDGYRVLEPFRWDERYADGYDDAGKAYARWQRWGDKLRLQPVPNWSGTLRVEYAKSYTTLSSPTQSLEFENSTWLEWVALDVCVKACAKLAQDPAVYLQQKKDLEGRIVAALKMEEDTWEMPKATSGSLTLLDLRRTVRGRGGWKRSTVSDNQLTQWINASIKQLLDIMAMGDSQRFNTLKDISIVSGTKRYDLPSDLYRLTGVAVEDSSTPDGYVVVRRFDFDERYDGLLTAQTKDEIRYSLVGDQIEFEPTPAFSSGCRLSYIPYPTALAGPTDTFDFRNGWEEWVVLDCCAKMAALAGQDPSPWLAMRGDFEKRINRNIVRDMAKPRTVVDSHRRWAKNRWWKGVTRW